MLDPDDGPVLGGLDHVEAVGGDDGEERADLVGLLERLDELVERRVGQGVAVVREEHVVIAEMTAHRAQALADIGEQPGIGEGDPPVFDVRAQHLERLAAAAEHEVVRDRLVIAQEIVLDHLGPIAQAEDEVLVPEVRVVAHDVPQDRARADGDHRLGDGFVVFAQAETLASAEQDDLHVFP